MSTLLVTGGAGFIGSALIRHLIATTDHHVVNIDSLTYAGNLESLGAAREHPRHHFVCADVADASAVREVFSAFEPAGVIHLAAESHVDRSIDAPAVFISTNVLGTFTLLQEARGYWQSLDPAAADRFRFLHVSTDEVFGSLGTAGRFDEHSPYDPSSPYSASKAAADHMARAWHRSYGLPTLVSNCSNNYGPYQFPEKLSPLTILNAIEGKHLPVYGRGENVRDWLFVEDHVRALLVVLERGVPGETYLVGGESEMRNIDVVTSICRALDELRPRTDGSRYESLIRFVEDRPGHDFRYAIDPRKLETQLGWRPQEKFESALRKTVRWYLDNVEWCQRVESGAYQRQRLGLQSIA